MHKTECKLVLRGAHRRRFETAMQEIMASRCPPSSGRRGWCDERRADAGRRRHRPRPPFLRPQAAYLVLHVLQLDVPFSDRHVAGEQGRDFVVRALHAHVSALAGRAIAPSHVHPVEDNHREIFLLAGRVPLVALLFAPVKEAPRDLVVQAAAAGTLVAHSEDAGARLQVRSGVVVLEGEGVDVFRADDEFLGGVALRLLGSLGGRHGGGLVVDEHGEPSRPHGLLDEAEHEVHVLVEGRKLGGSAHQQDVGVDDHDGLRADGPHPVPGVEERVVRPKRARAVRKELGFGAIVCVGF